MKTSRSHLVEIIHGVWPDLVDGHQKPGNIYIPDNNFILLPLETITEILRSTWFDQYKYIIEKFDCDDFALILNAFMKQESLKRESEYPYAFGEVWSTMLKGKKTSHAINLVVTDDEVVRLIEPQNDRMWEADSEKDHVHYLRI